MMVLTSLQQSVASIIATLQAVDDHLGIMLPLAAREPPEQARAQASLAAEESPLALYALSSMRKARKSK